MKVKKKVRTLLVFLTTMMLCLTTTLTAFADGLTIEKIFAYMPDVTVYFRTSESPEGVKASLGGQELTLTEEPQTLDAAVSAGQVMVQYNILLDISQSVGYYHFINICDGLKDFRESLEDQPGYTMALYTFGDEAEPKKELVPENTLEEASQILDELKNTGANDMTTSLFASINSAAQNIETRDMNEMGSIRRVLIVISDGVDDKDSGDVATHVASVLNDRGISMYTIAVDGGDTDKLSEFNAIAKQTGGISNTLSDEMKTADCLDNIHQAIKSTYRTIFKADSNKVSNTKEDMYLRLPSGTDDIREVKITEYQADNTAPTASAQVTGDNTLTVTYSEKVMGADTKTNYKIINGDGETVEIKEAAAGAEANSYDITTEEKLYEGNYSLSIKGVTDDSQDENVISEAPVAFTSTVTDDRDKTPPQVKATQSEDQKTITLKYSEPVVNADNDVYYTITNNEDQSQVKFELAMDGENTYVITFTDRVPKGSYTLKIDPKVTDEAGNSINDVSIGFESDGRFSFTEFLKDWWWLVLTIIVVLLIIAVIISFVLPRKNKEAAPQKPETPPVDMGETPQPLPSRDIGLWVNNGREEPYKMQITINGSSIVGRSPQCDVYCDDTAISKQHFVLSLEGGDVYITDLNSKNGTIVNGLKITGERRLSQGDEIIAGNITFTVEL